eukprot:2391367-Prymnesium_polylepis.1
MKKSSRPQQKHQHQHHMAHSPPERAVPAWHEDGDGACGLQAALQAATASVAGGGGAGAPGAASSQVKPGRVPAPPCPTLYGRA